MTKPWEISTEELQEWASRFEAAAILPRLVRRLLFATSPLDGIVMRADAGTRYEGWDGIVRGPRGGTTFCPAGLSVWELSVEKKVRTKLNDDYVKRSRKPPEGVQPALATYVAVTARAFPRKADWANEKRAEGLWADVRVYDADDLATWLEQAPAVARWYANLYGRPAYEGRDIEAFLEDWRKRTSPPLPSGLVLAGGTRQAQSDTLLASLSEPPGRPLLIRGRTRDEALLFAAATLARTPGAEARLSRALVVETEEAWRWALKVQGAESLTVLPAFDAPDTGQAAAAKVHVILPGDRGVPERFGSTLTLEEQPYPPLIKVLQEAGWITPEAERLVRAAGGELAALQRLCGYIDFKPPPWAKDSPRAELFALLLTGAWVPTADGDREVVRRLGGEPAVAEQLCGDLQASGVMTRVVEHLSPGLFRWTSPEDAWGLLARGLTDSHLDRFRDVVMEVLGAPDPAYELLKEERFMAAVKGKHLTHSDAIRRGLAESIARLSLHDATFTETHLVRRGCKLAEGLVKWLLRADRGWIAWASLYQFLPVLAEAAPKGFLDCVESSLDRREEGIAHLFVEEDALFGGAPHTGVLWALEVLAWHPEKSVRSRVVMALACLDKMDPGGRLQNRPLESLDTLLRYALPRSNTTVEERIELIKELFQKNSSTARKLTLGMLHNLRGGLLGGGYKPRFHTWAPKVESSEVNPADVNAQVRALLDELVMDAGAVPQRWADLVEAVLHGPEDVEEHVLNALARQRKHIKDPDGHLWGALRKAVSGLSPGDMEATRYERINNLYEQFTPNDLARRYAWLFASFPSLPGYTTGDVDEDEQRIDKERERAVKDVWQQSDPWDALARLTQEVSQGEHGAWNLGRTLAKSSFVQELEGRILADAVEAPLASLVVGFAATRAKELGPAWLENLLERLVKNSRLLEAARIASDSVDGQSIDYRTVWDILERLGEPLLGDYWRVVSRVFGHLQIEDLRYAIEQLVRARREDAAIQNAALGRRTATGALAFYVLDKYKERTLRDQSTGQPAPSRVNPLMPHHVERLFEFIDRDPPSDKDPIKDLAPLELFYLPILPQRSRPTRYVSLAFEDPDFFVHLVAMLYRREGEEHPVKEDAGRAQAARNSFTLLKVWKGYPGEGLPESERDAKLEAWAAEVLRKTREDGRSHVGSIHVAEVLARVPGGSDGFWPSFAARRMLETGQHPDLGNHLSMAKRNLRGFMGRALDEGGAQEREIAERYREAARQLEATYPRTAAMLDGLARRYDADAEQEDAEARRAQIEYGEKEEEEPPTPREPTTINGAQFVSRIITTGVGPASQFEVPLRPRMNLLIGDNSLGKTFILEVLWWALTGAWANLPARPPIRERTRRAAPAASILVQAGGRNLRGEFDSAKERWKKKGARSLAPGLTVYAQADGSFSVWDPIRNARASEKTEQDLSKGYHFTPSSLWYGLNARDGTAVLCRGLLEDTVSWRSERRDAFALLERVLAKLSLPEEPLKFGLPKRFKVRDALSHPTLDLGYDTNVFAVHASAAVKRILGLAYALVWAVSEIQQAAPIAGLAPLGRLTVLVDEVEAHLHPRWQRAILPALLSVIQDLAPQAEAQLIVTTHAPLVLASVETLFDDAQDSLLEFEQEPGAKGKIVRVVEEPWERLGDANTWLMQRFGLKQPRSKEAEDAIEQAAKAIEDPKVTKKRGRAIHKQLGEVLGELDPFWVRWRFLAEKRGWAP
jgi:hypothetical protein